MIESILRHLIISESKSLCPICPKEKMSLAQQNVLPVPVATDPKEVLTQDCNFWNWMASKTC